MSAAFVLPIKWDPSAAGQIEQRRIQQQAAARPDPGLGKHDYKPPANLAFYRKHTESLLRRFLYASMQVGRAPSILAIQSAGAGLQVVPFAPSRTRSSSSSILKPV